MSALDPALAALDGGRHELLAKLASGGMATVYLGVPHDARELARVVALKRPHQHLLDDPGFRGVLLAEARVASKLLHPNVVSVRELEHVGESYQLVMDWVEGASLGALLVRASKGGAPLPVAAVLSIVRDTAAGLDALHALAADDGAPLGFVHRDVSPQNVLVGVDGRARLTDFGLAKCARGSEQPTTQGTLKGKLGYMAPEYVGGSAIDRRADVFALGVVTWEALTGKRLFRGDNDADTLERVMRAPIPTLSSAAAALPPALDGVLATALARSADARYASAGELARALEAAARTADLAPDPGAVLIHLQRELGEEIAARRASLVRALAVPARPRAHAAAPSTLVPLLDPKPMVDAKRPEPTPPLSTPPAPPRPMRRALGAALALVGAIVVAAALGVTKRSTPDDAPAREIAPAPQRSPAAANLTPPRSAQAVRAAQTDTSTQVAAPRRPPAGRLQRELQKERERARNKARGDAVEQGMKGLPPNPYGTSEAKE